MWCLISHRDNVVSAYHNSVLPFTVVWDILHIAVSFVNWSQSNGGCCMHWNWCSIWGWEFYLLKIENLWHSLGSSSSRLCLRAVVRFRQCWSGIWQIWDYADMWSLSFHSNIYLYCGPLGYDILCSLVGIRGTHYHQLWKYMQYIPPEVHIAHLWPEFHNSKFAIFELLV
jgi:hypothetical protein